MSSTVYTTGYVSNVKDSKKSYSGRRNLLVYLLVALVMLVAVEIVFQLFIAPELLITKVQVYCSKDFQLTNADIIKIADIREKEYFFSVNTGVVEGKLLKNPLIKDIQVEKIFPGTLKIFITERNPLALSLVQMGNRSVPVMIDNEGVVFEIGKSVTDYTMPVISGLKFRDLKLGVKLPSALCEYFGDLKVLQDTSPLLFNQISELKFVRKSSSVYEVILYPLNGNIRIRTGADIDEGLLKQIFVVLDIIEKKGIESDMEELDFRSGQVVYRVKEG
jgi:cell division protein FtsQ